MFSNRWATSKSPTGPFKAEPAPVPGSYSIDPAVFTDTDGKTYMYSGGIWGVNFSAGTLEGMTKA